MPQRIDNLDTSVFDKIDTQTTPGDRRSLLALQRFVRMKSSEYAYLEIGSHLGGTIQPFLLDPMCVRIYSIDPRPLSQPDDRVQGYVACYENNSTSRMLQLLEAAGYGKIDKIVCIEKDAADVDKKDIPIRPHVILIDGEHTYRATVSDFNFVRTIAAPGGVVIFHDFHIVWRAIRDIIRTLAKDRVEFCAAKLEDNVFVISLDKSIAKHDPCLIEISSRNKYALLEAQLCQNFVGKAFVSLYKKSGLAISSMSRKR